jgi:hypothetical protein
VDVGLPFPPRPMSIRKFSVSLQAMRNCGAILQHARQEDQAVPQSQAGCTRLCIAEMRILSKANK